MTKVPANLLAKLSRLQHELKTAGLYSGPIDDDWGAGTDAAIDRISSFVPAAVVSSPPAAAGTHNLPAAYAWLVNLTLPKIVAEGLKLLGTIETAGAGNNPTIMAWAKEVGLDAIYTADAVPWCGLFASICATRAGYKKPSQPLWALSWSNFGVPAGQPSLGDVLTFTRESGGHVAIYIGEDSDNFHILGGNQSDKVCITRIAKKRLHSARRPNYATAPASVRPYILAPTGKVSTNEA